MVQGNRLTQTLQVMSCSGFIHPEKIFNGSLTKTGDENDGLHGN